MALIYRIFNFGVFVIALICCIFIFRGFVMTLTYDTILYKLLSLSDFCQLFTFPSTPDGNNSNGPSNIVAPTFIPQQTDNSDRSNADGKRNLGQFLPGTDGSFSQSIPCYNCSAYGHYAGSCPASKKDRPPSLGNRFVPSNINSPPSFQSNRNRFNPGNNYNNNFHQTPIQVTVNNEEVEYEKANLIVARFDMKRKDDARALALRAQNLKEAAEKEERDRIAIELEEKKRRTKNEKERNKKKKRKQYSSSSTSSSSSSSSSDSEDRKKRKRSRRKREEVSSSESYESRADKKKRISKESALVKESKLLAEQREAALREEIVKLKADQDKKLKEMHAFELAKTRKAGRPKAVVKKPIVTAKVVSPAKNTKKTQKYFSFFTYISVIIDISLFL